MIKLEFGYEDSEETTNTEKRINKEYCCIDEVISEFCNFLLMLGYSENVIQKYICYYDHTLYEVDEIFEEDAVE